MDLRNLPETLSSHQRTRERLSRVEQELEMDLSMLAAQEDLLGTADERNCENMIGHVPMPLGIAGPLTINFSSDETHDIYLPLATTEGALVASIARGCKVITAAKGVRTSSKQIGITRTVCFRLDNATMEKLEEIESEMNTHKHEWTVIGEATSNHLKIIHSKIDLSSPYIFLTLHGDSGDAMGMNMITIAAEHIARWITEHLGNGELTTVTIAGNVDSDKKPSKRTHDQGRGVTATAEITLSQETIETVLKTTPDAMVEVAKGKLEHGSEIAGALSSNLHAANTIAALYLALGQDAAHVVEGSLTDTTVKLPSLPAGEGWACPVPERSDWFRGEGLKIMVNLPALLLGTIGGGTSLPAQSKCLDLILKPETDLPPRLQLAESIAAAVLAGEVSLLAAQASQDLAKAHKVLARQIGG